MANVISTVKDLLTNSYIYAGVLSEGADLQGDRTTMGLTILNQLITQANMEVFLPFAQVIKDLPAGNQLYILTQDEDLLDTSTDEIKIPAELRNWGKGLIVEAIQPKIINSVGYKVGLRYTPLKRIGVPEMMRYTMNVQCAPSFYAYEEWNNFTALLLDKPSSFPLRVTYSKNIELVNINDKLNMPMQYIEYLMYGLAYRLAVKYQQPIESIAGIKSLFDAVYSNFVSLNMNDQTITWADNSDPSIGWYGEVLSPRNW